MKMDGKSPEDWVANSLKIGGLKAANIFAWIEKRKHFLREKAYRHVGN